ncbi:MAG: YebC/PmpR family DNA-binding transcriptional regulator [Bacteroidetes bacterium]|jgi:YebC/PmpR family DNA-binding regulatory protein|nr:YebC/PmpR family DNA-binding transcriptional regulator [Bacteroidota bacterium]MDA0942704.1 YebC/PmpR family DNA-binding transcriptional regulator [Bacteroidota bacterium]MDA1111358.1 YebC/PmpR family DNA-binding transcriptional regulator [Bacteroidota bacterium]
MGRMFEKRKHKMFARFDRMAKQFTKLGKEIAIAVKQGGDNPDNNPRLRTAMQNAKGVNMPKDRVDAAIKRASSKGEGNFEEIRYEGYGPNAVAILVETATDNGTRTVANVRMHFNKCGGTMGKTGSLDFVFTRKGVFTFAKESLASKDLEEFEFELIDHGLEDLAFDDELVYLYCGFTEFGMMQKALESMGLEPKSAELQYIPNSWVDLDDEQAKDVLDLIDRLEGDDDVQNVYHNLR